MNSESLFKVGVSINSAPILQRLNIPSENWLTIATQFEQHTFAAVGTETILSNYYQNAGYKRRSKISKAKQLLA
ncbi:hypothetical protein [Cycloclasticus pugetii]|uniref:hypothetical protein n=1 Tax=Cycloclasticus pugetii TaxID=34068 RepID=UPI003A8EE081